jgi:S-DNA-T family DNA segregation ATPase FtsK/SpoIIIE
MSRADFTTYLVGICLCGLSLFGFLSMVSYDPAAYAYTGEAVKTTTNVCGWAGNGLAYYLLNTWGYSAFVIPLLFIFWAYLIIRRREVRRVWLKVLGSIMLLFVCSGLAGLVFQEGGMNLMGGAGGLAGRFVGEDVLGKAGVFGGFVILLTFLAVSLFFVGEAAVYHAASTVVAKAIAQAGAARVRFVRWRESRPRREAAKFTPRVKRKRASEAIKKGLDAKAEPAPSQPARPPVHLSRPVPPPTSGRKYEPPPLDLLDEHSPVSAAGTKGFINESIETLNRALEDFAVDAAVVDYKRGPSVTMFEIELAAGVKVQRIMALSNDLAMALKASGLRIIAPIPGKSTVGIEVPNRAKELVRLKELLRSERLKDNLIRIPLLIGKDTSGLPCIEDLARMPHLLIAGTTGSGKSVCINALILSILYRRAPDEVKLILVDPKMVELSGYKDIPHLMTPVVTDMKKAPAILDWAVKKMDDRYRLFHQAGVRYIDDYNRLGRERIEEMFTDADGVGSEEIPYHLPHIVIIIDELADLMMVAAKEIQNNITRLAQKSRAVGLHVVVATQRPSVDVITGLIKSNIPARIAFQVASKVDSRTILDKNGAEKLLGSGDLLFLAPGTSQLTRAQGTFVSDAEMRKVVAYVKQQGSPSYSQELNLVGGEGMLGEMERDELYEDAVRIVLESQRGSVSLLQRRLEIGYTRASRLVDMMAAEGLVGPYKGSKAREVLMTLEDWEARSLQE